MVRFMSTSHDRAQKFMNKNLITLCGSLLSQTIYDSPCFCLDLFIIICYCKWGHNLRMHHMGNWTRVNMGVL